jgi:hypothetical protein
MPEYLLMLSPEPGNSQPIGDLYLITTPMSE